eukprot:474561-Hanusia_phi.AAC.1
MLSDVTTGEEFYVTTVGGKVNCIKQGTLTIRVTRNGEQVDTVYLQNVTASSSSSEEDSGEKYVTCRRKRQKKDTDRIAPSQEQAEVSDDDSDFDREG